MNNNYKSIIDTDKNDLNYDSNDKIYLNDNSTTNLNETSAINLNYDSNYNLEGGAPEETKYWKVTNDTSILYFKVTDEDNRNFERAIDEIKKRGEYYSIKLHDSDYNSLTNLKLFLIIQSKQYIDEKKLDGEYTWENFKKAIEKQLNIIEKIRYDNPKNNWIKLIFEQSNFPQFKRVSGLNKLYKIFGINNHSIKAIINKKKISNKIFEQTLNLVDILNKLQDDKYKTYNIVKEYFENDIKPTVFRTKKVKNDWHYYVLYMNQLYFHYKQNYLNLYQELISEGDTLSNYLQNETEDNKKYPKWIDDIFDENYSIPIRYLYDNNIIEGTIPGDKTHFKNNGMNLYSAKNLNEQNLNENIKTNGINNVYKEHLFYPIFKRDDEKNCYNLADHYLNSSEGGDTLENIFKSKDYWSEGRGQELTQGDMDYLDNLRGKSKGEWLAISEGLGENLWHEVNTNDNRNLIASNKFFHKK